MTSRRSAAARLAAVGALAAALALAVAAPAAADVDDFEFSSVEVDYYLTKDGNERSRLLVVEHWVADFPDVDQNRGIVREIPERDGTVELRPLVVFVDDEEGRPVRWRNADENGTVLEIDDDEFKHGEHHYVIGYRMHDVVRAFPEGDEFYPNVTGFGWAQPMRSVVARLHVAGEVAAALDGRVACFTGPEGSRASDCEVSEGVEPLGAWPEEAFGPDGGEATVIEVRATGGIAPHENLSFVVGLEPGAFVPPPEAWQVAVAPWVAGGAGAAALGVLGLAGITRARDRARLPRPRIVQYTPPRGVGIRVAAETLGRRSRLLAASVVDLAVSRRVELRTRDEEGEETDPERLSLVLRSAARISPDERELLEALFGPRFAEGDRIRLGLPSSRRAERIAGYLAATPARAREAGCVAGGRGGLVAGVVVLVVAALVALAVSLGLAADGYAPWWLPVIALVVVAASLGLAIVLRPSTVRVTARGAELVQYLEGMREYLELAEADRIRLLQSPETAERRRVGGIEPDEEPAEAAEPEQRLHLYERLLPYAVLFGVEKRWAAVLGELATELPEVSGGASVLALHHAVASGALASGLSTSASSPTSGGSSGSGFSSGGGFSGGGFGGGGGGGR